MAAPSQVPASDANPAVVRPSLVSIPAFQPLPWHWPFDARRLVAIRGLQVSLVILLAAIAFRFFVATSLGITDDEAWYWALSKDLSASYVVHPPLSIWFIRLSTEIFGDNLLGVRLPAVLLSGLGMFWLIRLVSRFGWAKVLTPPLFFALEPHYFFWAEY